MSLPAGNYTTYMYIEDDTHVPWPALVSWAFDTEVLEPLGFVRGFYRTEISPKTGDVVFLDITGRVTESQWNRSIQIASAPLVCNTTLGDWNVTQRIIGSPTTCLIHSTYIELRWIYMGMWISTHSQLEKFIHSEVWQKEKALGVVTLPNGIGIKFGYPERSTIFNQLLEVPAGHETASVIPYDSYTKKLATSAAVAHLRNAYYNLSAHSKIPVDALFAHDPNPTYRPTLILTKAQLRTPYV
jgi:hypothetical protein